MIMAHSHIASLRNALLGTAAAGAVLAITPSQSIHAESGAQPPAAPAVSVAVVEARDTTTWDEFSGRLEAVERVDVRSRVAGAVQEVHFTEGALVKKGQLLVSIDPAPYAAEA